MSKELLNKEKENLDIINSNTSSEDNIYSDSLSDNVLALIEECSEDTEYSSEKNNKTVSKENKTDIEKTDINNGTKTVESNICNQQKLFIHNKRYIIAIAVLLSLVAIIAITIGTIIITKKIDNLNKINATEPPTGTVVSATNETLSFKQKKYTVEVGKKIKVAYSYTPPTNKYKLPHPYITYISNNQDIVKIDSKGNVTGVSTGKTSITALADTGIYTTVPITVTAPKSHTIKNVPMLTQNYYYPSGCESVSSTMLLNYYGYKINTDDFIDKYLPMGDFYFDEYGNMLGPDTSSVFIGSPYSESALGCYPPVIEQAMNTYLKNRKYRAVDVTGASMDSLIYNYVANNQPVLIWATMYMWEPFVTYQWTVDGAKSYSPYKDGDTCQWLANEHCMVLVGYDEYYYYLNDPLYYYDTVAYSREIFDQRYKEIGMPALVLQKKW